MYGRETNKIVCRFAAIGVPMQSKQILAFGLACLAGLVCDQVVAQSAAQGVDGREQFASPINAFRSNIEESNFSNLEDICPEPEKPSRLTERSFLFTWPGQDCDDLRLNLCEPLITDRPDFTEASSTVGRGVTQVELGYTYLTDEDGGVRTDTHVYPELLIRQGLFRDWFELRVAYTAGTENEGPIRREGSADLYVGAKIGLTPQKGALPEMAIIPQAFLDTGSDVFTSGEDLFGVNWLYGWDLNDRLSLAGSTQFNRFVDDITANEYTLWAQSITAGLSLTEKTGAYFEWFAFFPDNADTDPVEHYLNGGLTRLINNNVQFDVRAGFGLNDSAQDFFVGTGLAIRFQ